MSNAGLAPAGKPFAASSTATAAPRGGRARHPQCRARRRLMGGAAALRCLELAGAWAVRPGTAGWLGGCFARPTGVLKIQALWVSSGVWAAGRLGGLAGS